LSRSCGVFSAFTSEQKYFPFRLARPAMTCEHRRVSKSIRWLLASAILIAVIVWVEVQLGWAGVLGAWSDVPLTTLAVLVLLTLVSFGLRAWRVWLYFGVADGHPFSAYLRISLIHNAFNNFLPARLGEASFPVMMKSGFGVRLVDSAAGLLWIRVMDLHFLLLLFALVAIAEIGAVMIPIAIAILAGPALLPWFLRLAISRRVAPVARVAAKLSDNAPASWGNALRLYAVTATVWTTKLAALTVLATLFIDIPGTRGLLGVIAADLSSVLPIHGLAGSGTFEGAMLAALVPLGVPADDVLLAAVNVHVYILIVTLFSVPAAFALPREWPRKLR
jgi:uncharacterized membrane protein YbhN (UPF0104 family)